MSTAYHVLNHLSAAYEHIIVSPHLDDAALSCGGMIATAIAAGQPVLVVNVCNAGSDPADGYGPLAQSLHQYWHLDAQEAMAVRMREDRAALAILGADSYQLDLLDAIYRMPNAYVDNPTLFGSIHVADPLGEQLRPHLHALAARYPTARFYAPLAIGFHVDHQIVHAVATELEHAGSSVSYYEDFPYVHWPGAIDRRWQALGGIEQFIGHTSSIDATITTRISAISAYQSQIEVLFGSAAAMTDSVTSYAAQVRPDGSDYGERVWSRR